MQKGEKSRKLSHLLAIVAGAVLALAGGFFLIKPFFPNVSNEILPLIPDRITAKIMTPYRDDRRFDTVDPAKVRIMLSKGDEKIIGEMKIVYRGLNDRSRIRLDVFVLKFDPEMPFAHTIDVAKAKKGFRLAGNDFQLISARRHRIHFWHHKKHEQKRTPLKL